jgi:RNA 2',3'-cyclic 3'-phosphodiesterase
MGVHAKLKLTRTFIALEMNDALQRHLTDVIRQVAQVLPTIRWVDPASIHLTLAFLGELNDEQVAEAVQATEIAAQQAHPFSYRLLHLGTFGLVHNPRVIWMGVEEASGSLAAIHRLLSQQLLQRGFAIETRPFSPHLTLARLKSPLSAQERQQLQSLLTDKSPNLVTTSAYAVHHLDVMKSELLRTGARYTCLQSCPMGKN